jgi:lipoprotein-anchoring transpeptidase ErfK/SrfK
MKKTIAGLLLALMMAAPALAETDGTNVRETPISGQPALVQKASPFQNPRFQQANLEAAWDGKSLAVGSHGEGVARVQQALLDLGFGIPAGVDGRFGGQTRTAVMAFQSSRGLAPSGVVDQATLRSLDKVAPAPGMKVWEDSRAASLATVPAPRWGDKLARAVVDLSEHRITIYGPQGEVQRVFPVASGAAATPTDTGIKVVSDHVANPTSLAWALWPESQGRAFGTRLLDLSWYDPATGRSWGSGEELHGTYATDSIGTYASHGCVRMTNDDVEWVYQNVAVGDIVVITR